MDPVREVLRLTHYTIRAEHCYCKWLAEPIEVAEGLLAPAVLIVPGISQRLIR